MASFAGVALGVGCTAPDGEDASSTYDALGSCKPGDERIETDDDDDDDEDEADGRDRDDDGGSAHDGGAHATRGKGIVKCRKGRGDGGAATDSGTRADAAPATDSGTSTDAGTTPDAGSTAHAAPAPAPAPATCTSFTYSAWGACQPNGTQTRTVTSSTPAGCTGGTPVLTQSCTYVDGAALYTQYCSGCHGTSKKGSTAAKIQSAIDNNVGGMGSLKFLTPEQIQAISTAP